MALEKELETYRRLIEDRERATELHGKYVLIAGDNISGFYSSFDDALQDGYKQFKPGSFLVKQVSAIEQVHFMSRFTPCRTSPVR